MKTRLACAMLAAALSTQLAWAGTQDAAAPESSGKCAVKVAPRTIEYNWMPVARWKQIHEEDMVVAESGNVDLMFVGDSITEGWPRAIWDASFAQYRPANLGIGGDNTGNVLWRLQDPRLAKAKPKAVVLLIGVNNFGLCDETPEQVFGGVKAVVAALRKLYPDARILLNAVLPAGQTTTDEKRMRIVALNKMVPALADGRHVVYRDYGPLFMKPDGSISPDIMGDFLHLTEKGYRIWSDAMLPDIRTLMK